jgi:hypothetical protein
VQLLLWGRVQQLLWEQVQVQQLLWEQVQGQLL